MDSWGTLGSLMFPKHRNMWVLYKAGKHLDLYHLLPGFLGTLPNCSLNTSLTPFLNIPARFICLKYFFHQVICLLRNLSCSSCQRIFKTSQLKILFSRDGPQPSFHPWFSLALNTSLVSCQANQQDNQPVSPEDARYCCLHVLVSGGVCPLLSLLLSFPPLHPPLHQYVLHFLQQNDLETSIQPSIVIPAPQKEFF